MFTLQLVLMRTDDIYDKDLLERSDSTYAMETTKSS